jgi:nicotinamidase/pyrazinamidase
MVTYTPSVALVVVDCQNDFADPSGNLHVEGSEQVVAACNAQVVRAIAAGAFVAYTQDWHPGSTPHFEKDGGIWPVHCVAGTWGAELHPRLLVAGPAVRKGASGEDGYSGFSMRDPVTGENSRTPLDSMIRGAAANHVVVVGLALDYCVKATAIDAVGLGYRSTVVGEATAAVEMVEGDGNRAWAELASLGVGRV